MKFKSKLLICPVPPVQDRVLDVGHQPGLKLAIWAGTCASSLLTGITSAAPLARAKHAQRELRQLCQLEGNAQKFQPQIADRERGHGYRTETSFSPRMATRTHTAPVSWLVWIRPAKNLTFRSLLGILRDGSPPSLRTHLSPGNSGVAPPWLPTVWGAPGGYPGALGVRHALGYPREPSKIPQHNPEVQNPP